MKNSLLLACRLALIVAVVVLMLAAVNLFTADKIAETEAAEGAQAREKLLPDAVFTKLSSDVIPAEWSDDVTSVYLAEKQGVTAGYFMDVVTSGYGGAIKLVVGLNPDLTVIGVQVISHSETSGIGSKAVDENGTLIPQLKGKTSSGVAEADGVSGATISSKAIKNGVLSAIAVGEALSEGGESNVG